MSKMIVNFIYFFFNFGENGQKTLPGGVSAGHLGAQNVAQAA